MHGQFWTRLMTGALVAGGAIGLHTATAQEDTFFTSQVWPILQARCFECHGMENQKGKLRLDFPEAIRRGGEFGAVVEPGKPDESTMIELISLPKGDADIMPNKGEPLTPEEIATIRKWIEDGASYGDWTPEFAFKSLGFTGELGGAKPGAEPDALQTLAQSIAAAAPEALDAIRQLGATANPLSQDNPLLQIGFHLKGQEVNDASLASLAPVAQQVTWLNLAGTAVTDAGMAQVAALPNLTRLHLEKTQITDAALDQLTGLQHLEYLNLYGTQVTDAGVAKLAGIANLKKLYLWQSQVTPQGAEALHASLPNLDINLGIEETAAVPEEAPAEGEAGGDLARFFDAEGCCAKAAAGGAACDHPCCKEAAAANTVCEKCNPNGAKKFAVTQLFDEGSCCGKAHAEGKDCDHPCCVEALAKGEVCAKCNPGAAEKAAAEAA